MEFQTNNLKLSLFRSRSVQMCWGWWIFRFSPLINNWLALTTYHSVRSMVDTGHMWALNYRLASCKFAHPMAMGTLHAQLCYGTPFANGPSSPTASEHIWNYWQYGVLFFAHFNEIHFLITHFFFSSISISGLSFFSFCLFMCVFILLKYGQVKCENENNDKEKKIA